MHEVVTSLGQSRTDRHSQCARIAQFVVYLLLLLLPFLAAPVDSLSSDGLALLQIKAAIRSDPLKLLSNWKQDDPNPCSWTGVACDPQSLRVVSLNLTGDAFCSLGETPSNCSYGFCSSFETCPSLLWQSPDLRCSSQGGFPTQASAGSICLRNGTVLESAVGYTGHDQVPCRLTGFLSSAIGNLTQLRIFSIAYNGLSGNLPKEVGALSFLEVLDLRGNAFSGRIPAEIGHLTNLQVLNVAYNSFEDEIPSEISGCRSVQVVNLAGNMLSGRIPLLLGSLTELQSLILSFNQLGGEIPRQLSTSCGNLEHLHLEGNLLIGTIPPDLGNCSRLKSLMVSSNFLSGFIPADLGSLGMLQALDISRNSLAGEIPPELGNCSQLSLLVFTNLLDTETCINRTVVDPSDGYTNKDKGEFNYFTGGLPDSIASLSFLRILWAPRAGLNENLPSYWGTCVSLEVLNLGGNTFTGDIPIGLVKCRKLIYLDLSNTGLEGNIPQQLPISCMVVFNVSGNFLSGSVSPSVGNSCPTAELLQPYFPASTSSMSLHDEGFSVNTIYLYFTSLYLGSVTSILPVGIAPQAMLVIHDLSQNNLTGLIPGPLIGADLGSRMPAYGFFLSENQFNGSIPSLLFSSCQNLQEFALVLSHNLLWGALPLDSMLGCTSLRHFEAASNQLTGSISPAMSKHLVYLDLGTNNFSGGIPAQVGQLQDLQYLILANNSLVGAIPLVLGNLTSLVELDLSKNHLKGEIPVDLANLDKLKYLRLSNNTLSGSIPSSLANLMSLIEMDLAFNNLTGAVPKNLCSEGNFVGNPHLQACSAVAPAPSSEHIHVPHPFALPPNSMIARRKPLLSLDLIIVVSATALMVVMSVLVLLICHCAKPRRPMHRGGSRRKDVVVFANISFRLTYDNVVRATRNFSLDNLIGTGGFGATYKAELTPGFLVAVKRLSLERFQGIQQFDAEIRTLGRIRHPHLVTLIGYHASESEMFLIYNYLPGGNLESLIHNREKGNIPWKVRYKIALNVAQALAYLHDECTPRVLHRDIKPSNILLDNSLNAYLSDFGLARLLGDSETHATTDVKGTFGYVAPEYAMTCRLSDKADVYSYGVVLLELLSGKKALDPSFSDHDDGFTIVVWACQLHKQGQQNEVFAPGLWEQGSHSELVDVLKLAITCTKDSLSQRPTMKQVVARLKSYRLNSSF